MAAAEGLKGASMRSLSWYMTNALAAGRCIRLFTSAFTKALLLRATNRCCFCEGVAALLSAFRALSKCWFWTMSYLEAPRFSSSRVLLVAPPNVDTVWSHSPS